MQSPYMAQIMDAASQYGVPPELAYRWINQESGFNPYSVSSKGAYGLTQLMPATAAELGVDPRDPLQNIQGGFRYLKQQYDKFGNWPHALAAYNAGPGAVQKYLKGGVLPSETQNYVKTITGQPLALAFNGATDAPLQQVQPQGKTPMPQQPPSLSAKFLAGGPGALFGAPNGVFPSADGTEGTGYDLGRGLELAGAGLVTAGGGNGAAIMNAANMPLFRQHFSVTRDALGRLVVINNKTGQIVGQAGPGGFNNQAGGAAPDAATALAQSPVALAARAKQDQEDSAKSLSSMRDVSTSAAQLRDKAAEALQLLQDPNISTGGFGDARQAAKNAVAGLSGGLITPGGTDAGGKFQKLAAQLQGLYLQGFKNMRLAGPEIRYAEMASPDLDKTTEVNKQILNDYIRQAELQQQAYRLANEHMKRFGVLGPRFNDAVQALYGPGATATLDNPPVNTGNRPPLSSFNR